MIMKKAVAVPYVIALILGVVVVGLIGYWFISQGGKTVGSGSKAECQGKLFQFCLTLRDNSPKTNLWDPKCNNILGINTTVPAIGDCP